MSGNSIGENFVVTCFGESHGKCVGVVIDGCPSGLPLSEEDIQLELDKRKPGISRIVSQRREIDEAQILSGIFKGRTTGAPICMLVWNRDVDSSFYEEIKDTPRPGHADYAARIRYGGYNDYRGGGRFSGRITAAFVMAGAVAKKLLSLKGIEVLAHTIQIGEIRLSSSPSIDDIRNNVYENPVRCADKETSRKMENAIRKVKGEGDSLGGVVECLALNVPPGVGEPIFDSLDADLAKFLFDIPAVKGVEIGAGFQAAWMRGSENNDPYMIEGGKVVSESNNAGGILGGLSSGMPITIRVAFKPTPSIQKAQKTVDLETNEEVEIKIKGKHDPCIVPRAVPVVESVTALVLVDHMVRMGLIPKVLEDL